MKRVIIKDFVESDLQFYREECNFTDEELIYFNMKAKGASDTMIVMNASFSLSKVNDLSKSVRKKIERVNNLFDKKIVSK